VIGLLLGNCWPRHTPRIRIWPTAKPYQRNRSAPRQRPWKPF